jgi:hypothetical protein
MEKVSKEFIWDVIKTFVVNALGVLCIGNAAVMGYRGIGDIWDGIIMMVLLFWGIVFTKKSYTEEKMKDYGPDLAMMYVGAKIKEEANQLNEYDKKVLEAGKIAGFDKKFDEYFGFGKKED